MAQVAGLILVCVVINLLLVCDERLAKQRGSAAGGVYSSECQGESCLEEACRFLVWRSASVMLLTITSKLAATEVEADSWRGARG